MASFIKETFTSGVSYVFPGKCFDELLVKYKFDNSQFHDSLMFHRLEVLIAEHQKIDIKLLHMAGIAY